MESTINNNGYILPFYKDKTIFLTGGTGFLGKFAIEVLLRTTEVKMIYILVRPKKEDPIERLKKEILGSSVFEFLKSQRDDFYDFAQKRLRVVEGDLMNENIISNESDVQMMIENVDVVIHCAATVRFDEPLDYAFKLNVLGALKMMELSKRFKKLVSFVHTSTAYVNCNRKEMYVEEKVYYLDFDPEERLIEMQNTPKEKLLKDEASILKKYGYPNTYTYTKTIAEMLLKERRGDFPLVIVRPAIVGAAYCDPHFGWVDNAQAVGAFFLSCGTGILTLSIGNVQTVADLIPVDMVVHTLIAAAVYAAHNPKEFKIFNSGSSSKNPVTVGQVRTAMVDYYRTHPSDKQIGTPDFLMLSSNSVYEFLFSLGYRLPMTWYSTVVGLVGNQKQQNLIKKGMRMKDLSYKIAVEFQHFLQKQWTYSTKNTEALFDLLPENEKRIFGFDVSVIDWRLFLSGMSWGLNNYVINDKSYVRPDEERLVPMYFERRFKSIFTDVRWAMFKAPHLNYIVNRKGEEISHLILQSKRVKQAIEQVSKKENLNKSTLEARAKKILQTMCGDFHMPLLRFLAWFFRKIYRMMYDHLLVDEKGLYNISKLMKSVAGKKTPVVFMPTQRSYLDFLVVSYIMFHYDMQFPHIAANDEFLNMFLVRWIFKHSGAFFVKQTFEDDPLYKAVFSEYVSRLMLDGFPLEIFIEGTRSRTGKNLQPKTGMLSVVLEPYFNKEIDDAYLVPISINYEKLVELDNHVRELMGEKKQKPSFNKFVQVVFGKVLGNSFGRINVQFAKPIKVSEYVDNARIEYGISDPRNNLDERKNLVRRLAHKVTNEFNKESVIVSTSIVSAILLENRKGIPLQQIYEKYDKIVKMIEERGFRTDLHLKTTTKTIVDRAVKLLGNDTCFNKHNNIQIKLDTQKDFVNMTKLGIYRNQFPHIFFLESIVCVSFHSLTSQEEINFTKLSQVIKRCEFLYELLSLEFQVSEDINFVPNFNEIINKMSQRKIVETDGDLFRISNEEVSLFFSSLIFPFIDAYWVASLALYSIVNKEIDEASLSTRMIWLMDKFFIDKVVSYYDCCTKEVMRNALTLFSRIGIIKGLENNYISLNGDKWNNEINLSSFSKQINPFRRLPLKDFVKRKEIISHYPLFLSKI